MSLGVDVGGTNTDAVLMDGASLIASGKLPTTPDVSDGIVYVSPAHGTGGASAPQALKNVTTRRLTDNHSRGPVPAFRWDAMTAWGLGCAVGFVERMSDWSLTSVTAIDTLLMGMVVLWVWNRLQWTAPK